MTSPALVPAPQVRHLTVAPEPTAAVVVPVQPVVLERPVVVPLQSRTAEADAVRRTTFAEAHEALAAYGRTS